MHVHEAIRNRISTRAFEDRPVPQSLVTDVLDTARWAPSGANTQPWQIAVATGDVLKSIGDAITDALRNQTPAKPDYSYYTESFPEPYRTRRFQCGLALYQALGIRRDDRAARQNQWTKNYYAFGAPVELFVFIDRILEKGSWLDLGMFIQNIMLAARGYGLETCPQAAFADYPDIVREKLRVPDERHLVCGIAMGYANAGAPVNQYRTTRDSVESFTEWHGFER